MIVVDVNVVAYFFIQGDRTDDARALFSQDPDWRLPTLWRHEYLNVLATFLRQGGAEVSEVLALWRQSIDWFAPAEQPADMEAALTLAGENRISAYDAQYVVLARQLETVCVTADKRLLKAFPKATRPLGPT